MPSSSEPSFTQNFVHFEQHVIKLFQNEGWTVETAKPNQTAYDLVLKKDDKLCAVQVKWLKSPVQKPHLSKFVDFLDTQNGRRFDGGFFITTQGYGGSARALVRTWGQNPKVICGIATQNEILWINDNLDAAPPEPPKPDKIYFGVFTCKGGVGKTTVAAHLAGAFALQGFNVALVDLDPEKNLQKLIGDGVYLPKPQNVGESIEVYDKDAWDEDAARDCKIVICDCSPAFDRNPAELVKKFDYCIIPTTFNPLGINKHGQVIKDTVKDIRKLNQTAHLFVLVNNFRKPTNRQMELLKNVFIQAYEDIKEIDDKFHCIDPEKVCIRSSDQLYYWGIHCLENPQEPRSELAFKLIGGKCKPREDFIDLAAYIERVAGLGILRSE